MTRPNTTTELMAQAGEALAKCDAHRLEELAAIAQTWMQTDEELEAQMTMLNAMIDAAYDLEQR